MKQEQILTHREIVNLKRYIEHKHPDYTVQRRASILANAIHRVIEGYLPELGREQKELLRQRLISRQLDRLTIHTDDIFRECLKLDLEDDTIINPLTDWVQSKLAFSVDRDQIRQLLKEAAGNSSELSEQSVLVGFGRRLEERKFNAIAAEMEARRSKVRSLPFIRLAIAAGIGLLILLASLIRAGQPSIPKQDVPVPLPDKPLKVTASTVLQRESGLPREYRFISVDHGKLQRYLMSRNSMLSEEPYLTAIIEVSEEYNIHPLLLFAITGQEQGFVPKNNKKAKQIANNPFNVFHSWKEYNTDIRDSATVASKLLVKASKERPEDIHPIRWINRLYAEDPDWWKGVTRIFQDMKEAVE